MLVLSTRCNSVSVCMQGGCFTSTDVCVQLPLTLLLNLNQHPSDRTEKHACVSTFPKPKSDK